ncbi:MAG: efflux RND transporter periplasmic adaptor subunit [Proteobacteria bacterium]|nr:efflux RND transporter periplasmic adaptor subunit [Pseudomonadota bacterium]
MYKAIKDLKSTVQSHRIYEQGYGAANKAGQRFGQLKPSIKIVVVMLALSVLWILSGVIFPNNHKLAKTMAGKQQGYKIETSKATQYQQYITISATTEAEKQVPLKVEIDAKVIEVVAKEGQYLKAGDPIVNLEVQNRKESLAQTEAAFKRAQIEYNASLALYDKQLASNADKALALANFKEAESAYKRAQLEMKRTIIRAPFNGIIDRIEVKAGDYMQAIQGTSVVGTFITKGTIIAVGYVPEKDIGQLSDGESVQLLRNGSEPITGKLHFISRIANPATRTFRVDVWAQSPEDDPIFSGQTVELKIPTATMNAHLVEASVTTMDMTGKLGVKVRDSSGVIQTVPIEIVGEEGGKFWISGLPDEAELVVLGQNYLQDGEKV